MKLQKEKNLKHPQLFCLFPLKLFIIPDNDIPIFKKYVTHTDNTKIATNLVIPIYLRKVNCKDISDFLKTKKEISVGVRSRST